MAEVGSASLTIVPKFDQLGASVERALGGVGQGAGRQMAQNAASGITGSLGSGALVGAFSTLTQNALSGITSHLGSAISRLDTLKNYPLVMQSLGVGAEEAQASIQLMSDRLQGLPTRLDDMSSTVQGIYAATDKYGVSLETATEAGLALNDMLLAGGGSTQVASAAMEQFRQMLSKGKPDMQDWKSLLQAAPGQMNQLAQSMLGPTATANDLYAALGGGGAEATISMEQLLEGIIALDQEGGEGFASLSDQAAEAQGGIGTAMANMENAVTKGLANVMDAVGRENIVAVFDGIKGSINDAFGVVVDVAEVAGPIAKGVFDAFSDAPAALLPAAGGLAAIASAVTGLPSAAKGLTGVSEAVFKLAESTGSEGLLNVAAGLSGIAGSLGPIVAIGGAAAIVIGSLVGAGLTYKGWQDDFTNATSGLTEAMEAGIAATSGGSRAIGDFGAATQRERFDVHEATASISAHADNIREMSASYEGQIARLGQARSVIEQYAGQTDLTTEEQGRLRAAVELVNQECGTQYDVTDALNGVLSDEEGNTDNVREAILDLIEEKQNLIRTDALQAQLGEAYAAQYEAAQGMTRARQAVDDAQASYDRAYETDPTGELTLIRQRELDEARAALEEMSAEYDAATQAVSGYEQELGIAVEATDEAADSYTKFAASMSSSGFWDSSNSISDFADQLRDLEVSTEWLESLDGSQLSQLAASYDGTAESVVSTLSEMGYGFDECREKMYDMGVSSEQMAKVSSEAFSTMLAACGGDLDELAFMIENYDNLPIDEKTGRISVEDDQLVDAQGNVYTWNGSELVDQQGHVAVDGTQLIDAQNRLYTWNGSSLQGKSARASVDSSSLSTAIDRLRIWNGMSAVTHTATSYVRNLVRTTYKNAAGGIRYHADGMIATRAVPLDIVGEAGAEAIVPLTNRRYSQPFVDLIAEGVAKLVGGGDVYNIVNIDGARINDTPAIRTATKDYLVELMRKGAM